MKESESRSKSQEKEEEEQWIESDYDDGAQLSDLFADPEPFETFNYKFDIEEDQINKTIDIELSGYKAELGQTLNSTGLTIWRASTLLCDFMVGHREQYINNKSVLELGAGLGLCGILAHHLHASQVTLTDGDTDTLANLRSNVQRNNCSATAIACQQLVWGRRLAEFQERHGTFDTILGSDIIYVEDNLEPLWQTVKQLLSVNGTFLLAYARRNVSIDLVLEHARQAGFSWSAADIAEGVFVFRQEE